MPSDDRPDTEIPHSDEENGMGDILHGLIPDEDADAAEEVREVRQRD